jgi:hypothetical protein
LIAAVICPEPEGTKTKTPCGAVGVATFGLPPLQGTDDAGDATGVGEAGGGAPVPPHASRITGSASAMKGLFGIKLG